MFAEAVRQKLLHMWFTLQYTASLNYLNQRFPSAEPQKYALFLGTSFFNIFYIFSLLTDSNPFFSYNENSHYYSVKDLYRRL